MEQPTIPAAHKPETVSIIFPGPLGSEGDRSGLLPATPPFVTRKSRLSEPSSMGDLTLSEFLSMQSS